GRSSSRSLSPRGLDWRGSSVGGGHGLPARLRRCPPRPESADQSTGGPSSTSLLHGGSPQREHHARLVRGSEFQPDEVREAAAPESFAHQSATAHNRVRVSEHTGENNVLGERSTPAIDGRRYTGQTTYASPTRCGI